MNAMTAAALPDAQPSPPWGTERPFSEAMHRFHENLAALDWASRASSFVFVRDYEGLPAHAPFDIDAMAEASDIPAVQRGFEETAEALGLVCLVRPGSKGINILVLELAHAPTYRTWSYFEIATDKALSRDFILRPRDMEITRTSGLPTPADSWRFVINLLQALRRDDLDRYRSVLQSCQESAPGCLALAAEKLGATTEDVAEIVRSGSSLARWQESLGIRVKTPAPAPRPSWRNRLRRAALRRFYVLPAPEMYLISIHGADGVGKSTACSRVEDMFAGYPIGLDACHHVTSWKRQAAPKVPESASPAASAGAQRRSPVRAILSSGYRAAPEFVRDWWRAMTGYHHYGRSLNRKIFAGYLDHRVMILDRYVYDMYLKLGIRGGVGRLGRLTGYLSCMALRRPLQAILIVDQPEAVIARKQELTLEEIDTYQTSMARLLERLGVRHTIIRVDGRDAEAVANELARTIIDAIGPDLLQLMRYTVNPMVAR